MTSIVCVASTALPFSGINRQSSCYAFSTGLLKTAALQKWSGKAGKRRVRVVACSVGKGQQKSGSWPVVAMYIFT